MGVAIIKYKNIDNIKKAYIEFTPPILGVCKLIEITPKTAEMLEDINQKDLFKMFKYKKDYNIKWKKYN